MEYPRLVGAVALIAGSRAVAEDAVQEALARAWERSDRGERIESLRAWVMTVAINLVRSGFRRLLAERRARQRMESAQALRDVGRDGTDEFVDLRRALAALPRRQREATVLRYYLDLDVAEVARVMGMAEGTAKTTLHRARLALARSLGSDEAREANERA